MGEQSASRLAGDDYQHLFSWYELLGLLESDSAFESAHIEAPGVDGVDDITFTPRPGSGHPARFVQVKWHVDSRAYSFDNLCAAPAGKLPLLTRMFRGWRTLRDGGPVEICLLSNWACAPDNLGIYVSGQDHTLRGSFFTHGPRTIAGKARSKWQETVGATAPELADFCRSLRFRLGFGSTADLECRVDDRMARHQLRCGANPRFTAVGLVRKWIQAGGARKRVDRAALEATLREHQLHQPMPEQAPPYGLWVHGWVRRAFDRTPTFELDWTPFFDLDTRTIPAQDRWDGELFPELNRCRDVLGQRPQPHHLDFRGKLPLTAVLAIGSRFPEAAGYVFRTEQPTRGETFLWRSDAKTTSRSLSLTERRLNPESRDIIVVLSITGDAQADVERFIAQDASNFGAAVFAIPDGGSGDGSLRSAGDAVALAIAAKDAIRSVRARYGATAIHLIPYAPASFCLFLGQRLNALGDIVTYERTRDGGYQRSVTLRTR